MHGKCRTLLKEFVEIYQQHQSSQWAVLMCWCACRQLAACAAARLRANTSKGRMSFQGIEVVAMFTLTPGCGRDGKWSGTFIGITASSGHTQMIAIFLWSVESGPQGNHNRSRQKQQTTKYRKTTTKKKKIKTPVVITCFGCLAMLCLGSLQSYFFLFGFASAVETKKTHNRHWNG